MFDDLTLQQFCALDYNRNMVVTSGPGAGKTRILSHRFCFILLTDDAVSIPQILTLTFTEKAAEEMKGRIYEMLGRLESDIGKDGDDTVREKIRKARDQFHKNRISTIHSFCANLLREHPVEAGIDPTFSVIHGARQKGIMKDSVGAGISYIWRKDRDLLMPLLQSFGNRDNLIRAIRNVIEHPVTFDRVVDTKENLFKTNKWKEGVFREYCRHIRDKSVIPYLNGLRKLENGKDQYDELLDLMEEWRLKSEEDRDTFNIPGLFKELRRMVNDRRSSSSRLAIEDGLRQISYVDLVEEYYPDIFSLQSPDSIFENELDLFLRVAKACMDTYTEEKQKINALDFADLEARSYSFLLDLYENRDQGQLKRIQKRFRHIMVDEFQDTNRVQWDIIRLLCSYRDQRGESRLKPGKLFVVGDKRQAIYRFRGGDVTVFESVTEQIKDSNHEKPVQMFWQDDKMLDILTRVYKNHSELLEKYAKAYSDLDISEREDIQRGDIYLPHNFRSDSKPINFFNKVFTEIFSNKGLKRFKKYETAPKRITLPDGDGKSGSSEGSVTFYPHQSSSRTKDKYEKEAALIVDIIESILGRQGKDSYEYRSYADIREKIEKNKPAIGILFFTFRHLKTFESIFREADLPFMVHRGKGFFRCREVMEMLQILNFLADERRKISLLATMRGPIFGLTDPEVFDLFYNGFTLDKIHGSENPYIREVGMKIEQWRFFSGRMTIAELIRKIITDQSLTAIYSAHPNGPQRMANIEKLIEIARRFQSDGNGSLPEFVKYCLEMAGEEEEEGEALIIPEKGSSIFLMTIHAAKGLEFPMVIIPDLDRRPPARPKPGRPLRLYPSDDQGPGTWNHREGEIPVWGVEIPRLDYLKKYSPLGYLLMRRNMLEDMAENRRVFYVACTRAENHLILTGGLNKRLMENERRSLTSDDYRERTAILDLLDDIYGFNLNFPPERSKIHEGRGDLPAVVWRDPEAREYKGVYYNNESVKRDDFCSYDERIRKIDLTGAIRTPPYLQLSFKSIRIFKNCPVRFYYDVVLGIKSAGTRSTGLLEDAPFLTDVNRKEEDEQEYGSEKALFLGSLIHEYLEKHRFGGPFDEEIFNGMWERLSCSYRDKGLGNDVLLALKGKSFDHLKKTLSDSRLIDLLGGSAGYAEVQFLFSVSNGIEFRGVIDRLFRDKDSGSWMIIDWKSNDLEKRNPDDVAKEEDYYLQLSCYKWAVESILNEKVAGLYIYFTDKGHLLESHTDDNPERVIDEMLAKIRDYEEKRQNLENDQKRIREESTRCLSCGYRDTFCKIR